MKCRKCLISIEPDSRFCRHCGARVARVLGAGINAETAMPAMAASGVSSRSTSAQQTLTPPRRAGIRPTSLIREPVESSDDIESTAETPASTGDVYRDPRFEQTVWQGRPAWRAFLGSWILWFLLSIASLYSATRYTAGDAAMVQVVWIFIVGAAVTILVREALVVYGLRYQLTTQRLIIHRGILTRVTDQMELLRVDDVRLMQGIIDRMANTGSVEVFSSDESDEQAILQSVSGPVELAEALRLHVRGARSKGTLAVERV